MSEDKPSKPTGGFVTAYLRQPLRSLEEAQQESGTEPPDAGAVETEQKPKT